MLASITALALNACASERSNIVVGDAVCVSPVPLRRTPLPVATPAQRAGLLAAGFSAEAVHIADVIGAAAPLLASVDSTGRNSASAFNSSASVHVAISVERAILEVQGTMASLFCQGARIAELQDDLNQRNADINNRFAMAGIAIGAGAAVVTGGMSFFTNATIPTVAGMVAGGAGGALSVWQLGVDATGRLRLQQNMLEEFWRAPEHATLFPMRVWRYLNTRERAGEQTPREMMIASWRRDGLIPDQDATPEPPAIILDRTAMDSDDLEKLKLLLEPLEARIGLMSRDLGRLLEEFLERSEAAALSRPTAPPRRRPAA
ncbi:MAG: hypothetical protein EBY30_05315 [Rhodospirillales bacterium]|nr:hypothetical protein [Rhodospirillales bacterium]